MLPYPETFSQPLSDHTLQQILQLWCMSGIGPRTLQALWPALQQGWAVSDGIDPAIMSLNMRQQKALLDRASQNTALATVDKVRAWALAANHHLVILGQGEEYPALLREIPSPPPVLMVQGSVDVLRKPGLGMVGSRNPSAEGERNAQLFAEFLAKQQLVVTSGGASGIDKVCHETVLKSGGETIAVLGHALDKCYPASHRLLFNRIAEQGALVSEFPLGVGPRPQFFPRRNRIITGLSLGVCVVEAGLPSGSLVSARWAYEQNREVFAIPGSIHNPRTKGCHTLIQQGAKLVQSGEDILTELHYLLPEPSFELMAPECASNCSGQSSRQIFDASQVAQKATTSSVVVAKTLDASGLSDLELHILSSIDHSGVSMDHIVDVCSGVSVNVLSSHLTMMEIEGIITRDSVSGLFRT